MAVKIIKNEVEFGEILESEEDKLVVLEFMALWSEPSRFMKNIYDTIAGGQRYKNRAVFCALDVNNFKELAGYLGVEALPTFVLVKDYTVKARVVGVNKADLTKSLDQVLQLKKNGDQQ